jgi:hypothetical protein
MNLNASLFKMLHQYRCGLMLYLKYSSLMVWESVPLSPWEATINTTTTSTGESMKYSIANTDCVILL